MNIQEATKKAVEENRYISRNNEEWNSSEVNDARFKIKPTDGGGGCVLVVDKIGKERTSRRGWQPSARDFIADDWIVLD